MKWLYGLLCLFFLIIFHEFGHFIACKIFGVQVESFSVGFGPVLFHKKIKGTDYRFSLIPLGGYCGMKGDKDFQEAVEKDLPEIITSKDALYGVHPLKRAFIGFAGPLFNFIFAVIAYSFINGISYNYYTYSNKIILADEIYEDVTSSARTAGLLTGDRIIKIKNKEIEDFSDIAAEISVRPGEDVEVTVLRNDKELTFTVFVEMNKSEGTGKIGIVADQNTLIEKESVSYPFFKAIYHGFIDSCKSTFITIKSIGILFKGADIKKSIGGPARITDMLGSSIEQGFSNSFKVGIISLFNLTGIISISLFIMNLLPIPVLDGGLILIAILECITNKKIRPKVQYYIQYVGLFFLVTLFIIGLVSDISYFTNRG